MSRCTYNSADGFMGYNCPEDAVKADLCWQHYMVRYGKYEHGRNEVIEECAKIAEGNEWIIARTEIATAIRALKTS